MLLWFVCVRVGGVGLRDHEKNAISKFVVGKHYFLGWIVIVEVAKTNQYSHLKLATNKL